MSVISRYCSTTFSILGSKFERFNNNRSAIQVSDIGYYNLQFELACLLKNIWQLVQDYKIEELPHHMLWHCDNFEIPIIENKLHIAFNDEIKINKNLNDMNELQNKLLYMNLEDLKVDDIVFEDEDAIMDELSRKNKRHKHPVIIVENHNN